MLDECSRLEKDDSLYILVLPRERVTAEALIRIGDAEIKVSISGASRSNVVI